MGPVWVVGWPAPIQRPLCGDGTVYCSAALKIVSLGSLEYLEPLLVRNPDGKIYRHS
ncbi:hypothetical protein ABH917_003201 [Thermobifida halotolerans]